MKVGDKIRIVKMSDDLSGIEYEGREGVIEHIDSMGQLHGTWVDLQLFLKLILCKFSSKKDMTIKEAILNELELNNITPRILPSVEFRAPVKNYKEFYTKEQLDYLWAHGMLEEYKKIGATWENPYEDYWQFTDKGHLWRLWYTTDLWTLIKIYVLHTYVWESKWDVLKYKLFGIRAGWMEYSSAYGGEDWDGQ